MEQPDKKIKKVLHFIKKKERTDEEIEKFLGSKDDWDLMLDGFLDDGFIRPAYDEKYVITPRGEEYLTRDSLIDKKQWFPIIVSFSVALFSVWYANQLTEPYRVLMEPTLRMYLAPTHEGLAKLSASEFDKKTGGLEHINVCIENKVGRKTGNIYYRINAELNEGISSSIVHIPDLIGGNSSCETITLSQIAIPSNRTEEHGLYLMEKPTLQKGKMKLNVTLDCDNCQHQKQAHYLNACIYYTSYMVDC